MTHEIFYDDDCPFCRRSVARIARLDKKHIFVFVPQIKKVNTLILKEANGKTWIRGRAVLRIFWLLGGVFRLFGWLYLIPFFPDLVYRVIARLRHHL